jgi:hypothetical protein
MHFGITLGNCVAETGFEPAMRYRPWWLYFADVFKSTFVAFPMKITPEVEAFIGHRVALRIFVPPALASKGS